ncbi:hypothetical protein PYW08_013074 [Mythimna loreyi]|uniref:Uncharacterized protein n=1 Tax=Mythimna loreyi TaxID=667449 RepID=A0ACC2Q1E3_9NEOP|nr:hypothetical protein PYW08_013074 [Mythimna loreyi]
MSLRRTPPNTPKDETIKLSVSSRAITQSGSTPNLTTVERENVAAGLKRKRDDICMEEIRQLLANAAAQSESKYAVLQESISAISTQNEDIKSSIAFISKQYDDLIAKIGQLESERQADRCLIQRLEETVENLERQLQSTRIEIKNVPKRPGEGKIDLCELVKTTASVLGAPVQSQDIKEVFRINKKDDPSSSQIIVEFSSAATKETIIKGVRQFNIKNKTCKLNTTHLKLEGPARPVYVTEKLTSKAQRLYYLARTFAKDNAFKYCWTSYGRVYLRQAEGKKQIPIRKDEDLDILRLNK